MSEGPLAELNCSGRGGMEIVGERSEKERPKQERTRDPEVDHNADDTDTSKTTTHRSATNIFISILLSASALALMSCAACLPQMTSVGATTHLRLPATYSPAFDTQSSFSPLCISEFSSTTIGLIDYQNKSYNLHCLGNEGTCVVGAKAARVTLRDNTTSFRKTMSDKQRVSCNSVFEYFLFGHFQISDPHKLTDLCLNDADVTTSTDEHWWGEEQRRNPGGSNIHSLCRRSSVDGMLALQRHEQHDAYSEPLSSPSLFSSFPFSLPFMYMYSLARTTAETTENAAPTITAESASSRRISKGFRFLFMSLLSGEVDGLLTIFGGLSGTNGSSFCSSSSASLLPENLGLRPAGAGANADTNLKTTRLLSGDPYVNVDSTREDALAAAHKMNLVAEETTKEVDGEILVSGSILGKDEVHDLRRHHHISDDGSKICARDEVHTAAVQHPELEQSRRVREHRIVLHERLRDASFLVAFGFFFTGALLVGRSVSAIHFCFIKARRKLRRFRRAYSLHRFHLFQNSEEAGEGISILAAFAALTNGNKACDNTGISSNDSAERTRGGACISQNPDGAAGAYCHRHHSPTATTATMSSAGNGMVAHQCCGASRCIACVRNPPELKTSCGGTAPITTSEKRTLLFLQEMRDLFFKEEAKVTNEENLGGGRDSGEGAEKKEKGEEGVTNGGQGSTKRRRLKGLTTDFELRLSLGVNVFVFFSVLIALILISEVFFFSTFSHQSADQLVILRQRTTMAAEEPECGLQTEKSFLDRPSFEILTSCVFDHRHRRNGSQRIIFDERKHAALSAGFCLLFISSLFIALDVMRAVEQLLAI